MRVGISSDTELPSHALAEQAVDVAVYGKQNRVVISQMGPHGSGAASAGGVSSSGDGPPESRPRRLMWRLAGTAGVLAAGAAVAAIFVR